MRASELLRGVDDQHYLFLKCTLPNTRRSIKLPSEINPVKTYWKRRVLLSSLLEARGKALCYNRVTNLLAFLNCTNILELFISNICEGAR